MRRSTLPSRPPAATGDLARLVDPPAVAEALARAGLRSPERGPLRLEKAWPLPRIPLMLLFGDRRPGAVPGPPWWSLHALPEGRPPGAYRRAVAAGLAVELEGLGALAQRFPDDLMLPALTELLERPGAALRGLAGAGRGRGEEIRIRLLGYKPARRCSLMIHVAGRGGRRLFGKLLPPPVARAQWRVHEALGGAFALAAGNGVEAAAPEAIVPELGLLVWRRRGGASVHRLLDRAGAVAVAAAGRALAGLHASRIAWVETHGPERELATLGLWVGAAAGAFPGRAAALSAAEERVRTAAGRAPAGPLLPAHRDFYDKQVLLDGARTVLLDFETACRAEPELDVANFVAHLELRRLQRSRPLEGDLERLFLTAYESIAGRPERARLAWYRAAALLRLACVYAFRNGWDALSDDLLAAADEASRNDNRAIWRS